MHDPEDRPDHAVSGFSMLDHLRVRRCLRKLTKALLPEILRSRAGQETAAHQECLIGFLQNHLTLEVAHLVAFRLRGVRRVSRATLQVEVSNSVSPVIFDLSPSGHRDQLLAVIGNLVNENFLQEITTLVDLIGVKEHAGNLLEEDPRLYFTSYIGRVEKLVVDFASAVIRARLHVDDEIASEDPDKYSEGQNGRKDRTVTDPAGSQGDDLAVGGHPAEPDKNSEKNRHRQTHDEYTRQVEEQNQSHGMNRQILLDRQFREFEKGVHQKDENVDPESDQRGRENLPEDVSPDYFRWSSQVHGDRCYGQSIGTSTG